MNREDEPLDLSVLDPSRDKQRWDRMVGSVASRALAARRRRRPIEYQMMAWAGPVLAAAAAVALVSWLGALGDDARGTAESAIASEPAFVLSSWAANEERPAPATILEVLGDENGAN